MVGKLARRIKRRGGREKKKPRRWGGRGKEGKGQKRTAEKKEVEGREGNQSDA